MFADEQVIQQIGIFGNSIRQLEAENARLRAALEQALTRAREQADLWRDEDDGDIGHADWWNEEATRLAVALTP